MRTKRKFTQLNIPPPTQNRFEILQMNDDNSSTERDEDKMGNKIPNCSPCKRYMDK